jgi:hypothetical protein
MTAGLAIVLFLVVVGGLIALGVRAWRGRREHEVEGGLDLIPYLLLALALGITGFSLARLARASLTPDQFAGAPTGEIAAALAGLVVAAPIAYLLWRRQSTRRKAFPRTPGWPIYLAVVEAVFLTAFLVSVGQLADALTSSAVTEKWTDLVVFGAIVAFHWWAERREPPYDDAGELPRLIGSGVSLVGLGVGTIGTLTWLLSEAYEGLGGTIDVLEPAVPLALLIASAPVWAYRWLPAWRDESSSFRNLYLSVITSVTLTMAIGAGVTMIAVLLTFVLGRAGPAAAHFQAYPPALAIAIAGGAFWWHHRRRLGPGRTGALRGYEYAMAAVGLGTTIGSVVALINAAFQPQLAGGNTGEVLIILGCSAIAGGAVWLWFWRKAQASPRAEEINALPRRIYLIGMAVATGLTAAGALIGSLVVVFRALLGEGGDIADSLRIPLSLTVVSGLAAWHLFNQVRADSIGLKRMEGKPFTVTVVCSHPGGLAARFPKEAKTRVIYRADDAGMIDDEMAEAIVSAVAGTTSIVWVDESGFRVAPVRES